MKPHPTTVIRWRVAAGLVRAWGWLTPEQARQVKKWHEENTAHLDRENMKKRGYLDDDGPETSPENGGQIVE